AQLDRFLFKLSMGYMAREHELDVMFDNAVNLSIEDLGAVIDLADVEAMIRYATTVEISREVGFYIVDLINASRNDPAVSVGGSPCADGRWRAATRSRTPSSPARSTPGSSRWSAHSG